MDISLYIFFLGFITLLGILSKLFALVIRMYFGTKASPDRYGHNSWAIVTGASDGIGKEFALDLARRGFNIVLISRSINKLNDVAN